MFVIGQRWYSEGEPELGLGIVQSVEQRLVNILYPLSGEKRTYNTKSSPLKRFTLEINDSLTTQNGEEFNITDIKINDSIIFYLSDDVVIPEMNLQSKIDLHGPLDRLLAKSIDESRFYTLRYDSYLHYRKYESFPHKGLLGPKIRLIPHQIYVADSILKMNSPKAMLCDEVGLGKTIEACMVLNSLLLQNRVNNVLIIVPDSLINQWFVELYRKFHQNFHINELLDESSDLSTLTKLIVGHNQLIEDQELLLLVTETKWDMLIIDEAHQLNFGKDNDDLVRLIKSINQKTHSALLLSATPEVLGEDNLYYQLNFLDEAKYHDLEAFKSFYRESLHISKLINQTDLSSAPQIKSYFSSEELSSFNNNDDQIKKALIDRYGTGRNYFRNSRSNLEKYHRLFNARVLHQYPVSIAGPVNDNSVFKGKVAVVSEILNKNEEAKILIICHSKDIVLKLQKNLLQLRNYKLAVFHSDQSLLERDRQAAYFADEQGAEILICTEVGSEGRNFEFSSHLILFDLPKLPDQLEQRIGRLDRIGQINNINIHIPYIKNSFEEILFRWYHEVLNAIESSPKGAHKFYELNRNHILKLIENPFDGKKLNQFVDFAKEEYTHYAQELEKGRDLIVETNSYNHNEAKEIVKAIREYEELNSPAEYLMDICENLSIQFDEHAHLKYFIKPTDNMTIPSYAGLDPEGQTISFDRDFSLKYDNIQLCSWEHPLILTAFDLMLNSSLGNLTVIANETIKRNVYFELIMALQCTDENKYKSALYMPFTPLRILLNLQGIDETKNYSKKIIDQDSEHADQELLMLLGQIPKNIIQDIIKKAQKSASDRTNKYINQAIEDIDNYFIHEKTRLKSLNHDKDSTTKKLNELEVEQKALKQSVYNANLKLDAIRVIIPKS